MGVGRWWYADRRWWTVGFSIHGRGRKRRREERAGRDIHVVVPWPTLRSRLKNTVKLCADKENGHCSARCVGSGAWTRGFKVGGEGR